MSTLCGADFQPFVGIVGAAGQTVSADCFHYYNRDVETGFDKYPFVFPDLPQGADVSQSYEVRVHQDVDNNFPSSALHATYGHGYEPGFANRGTENCPAGPFNLVPVGESEGINGLPSGYNVVLPELGSKSPAAVDDSYNYINPVKAPGQKVSPLAITLPSSAPPGAYSAVYSADASIYDSTGEYFFWGERWISGAVLVRYPQPTLLSRAVTVPLGAGGFQIDVHLPPGSVPLPPGTDPNPADPNPSAIRMLGYFSPLTFPAGDWGVTNYFDPLWIILKRNIAAETDAANTPTYSCSVTLPAGQPSQYYLYSAAHFEPISGTDLENNPFVNCAVGLLPDFAEVVAITYAISTPASANSSSALSQDAHRRPLAAKADLSAQTGALGFYSNDAGHTFKSSPIDADPTCADVSLLVDTHTNRYAAVYTKGATGSAALYSAFGPILDTFAPDAAPKAITGISGTFPIVALHPTDRLFALMALVSGGSLIAAESGDGGRTWGAAGTIAPGVDLSKSGRAGLCWLGEMVFCAYAAGTGVAVAVSRDRGRTWTPAASAGADGPYSGLSLLGWQGTLSLLAFYLSGSPPTSVPVLMRSQNLGAAWQSSPVALPGSAALTPPSALGILPASGQLRLDTRYKSNDDGATWISD